MGLVGGLWLALLGVLAVPSLIIDRKPDARQLFDKMAPHQGWIGAISVLWGAWMILFMVLSLRMLSTWPIRWITFLVSGMLELALGLLLGAGVLKQFIKQPQAVQRMDQTVGKLAPKQGLLGLIAIGFGVWAIIAGFLPF